MCKSAIEIELEKIFMEQNCFEKEYIKIFKDKFNNNNKQLKRLILANFMNHINHNDSLALFDEDIFNIYKTIIDNYIIFLSQEKNTSFKFNDEIIKNLSGITSVLNSQISFFCDDKDMEINPIYTEKKTIIAKYIDNVYKNIDSLPFDDYEHFEVKTFKNNLINSIAENIKDCYKTNLINCFNAINDIENRKEISYFNDVLEEEREILSSMIKLQVKALEDLCKDDKEKDQIEKLLKPIIEAYQQTGKSFEELNNKIKNIDTNITIDFSLDNDKIDKSIFNIFKDVKDIEEKFKEKALAIFEQYILSLKENIILKEQEKINLTKNNIYKSLNLSLDIYNMFNNIVKYIEENKEIYEKSDLYNIIDGIKESITIKTENIKEKEEEILKEKESVYNNIEKELESLKNYNIQFDFDTIYDILKKDFNTEEIKQYININDMTNSLEKALKLYVKKIDDFIKNTILFEISTFQEIMYYSVSRLKESDDEKILSFTKYIEDIEQDIEKCLINNNILPIKPKPHDMFDAKEHEVLLAEKNEDFNKGQVIKVINYGYKKKDEGVIKRATIIAAK